MLVSAVQQRESVVSIYKTPPSWASLPPAPPSHPSRLSQSTEMSSLCHRAQGTTSYLLYTWQCIYVKDTLSIRPMSGSLLYLPVTQTPFISFTVLVTNWSVALFTFHSLPPWNISPIWTANVPALLAGSFCSRCLHPATLYLAKAAFSQHHQEVKIGQFHPVPVAVVV